MIPVLVVGDLNTTPWSPAFRSLQVRRIAPRSAPVALASNRPGRRDGV